MSTIPIRVEKKQSAIVRIMPQLKMNARRAGLYKGFIEFMVNRFEKAVAAISAPLKFRPESCEKTE